MGPNAILDKSAFQSLSQREHLWFHAYFEENLTPVLVSEIAADLSKQMKPGQRSPEVITQELARKVGGSGRPLNVSFRILCLGSLGGQHVEMSGFPHFDGGQLVRDADGSAGVFFDVGPANYLILRLADGAATPEDRAFANWWRANSTTLSLNGLRDFLARRNVTLTAPCSPAEVGAVVDVALAAPAHQLAWFECMLLLLETPPKIEPYLRQRWNLQQPTTLLDFAPYAHHCLRATLMLCVAEAGRQVEPRPTNAIDLQYLYYLPFCDVFSSHDGLHRVLAPMLIRADQSWVPMKELKDGLRQIADFQEALTHPQKLQLAYALGVHPPPVANSALTTVWRRHVPGWRGVRRHVTLSVSEKPRRRCLPSGSFEGPDCRSSHRRRRWHRSEHRPTY